jgi:hypothetical protein
MLTAWIVIAATLLLVAMLGLALARLGRDDHAQRRLERSEYQPLVKHIWWQ